MNGGGVTTLCYDATGFSCAGAGYNGTSGQIGGNGWSPNQYWAYGSPGPNGTRHNCTTYAAYRLQQNGYAYPGWTDNANGWANKAWAHGTNVDQTPAVGAIAQWNRNTGHVAYVEAVTSSYIETTSDSYDGGTDHIRIALNSAYMPDNFIHFKDQAGPPPSAAGTDLALNGGFNLGSNNWSILGTANWTTYTAGQVTGTNPYEGARFGATNTGTGGSIYQDINYPTSAGQTVCASGEFTTEGTGSGAGGSLAVFLIGGSSTDSSGRGFGPLPGNGRWTPASTCATATGSHSTIRVQVYPNSNAPTLDMDAIDTQVAGFGVGYQRPSIVTGKLPTGRVAKRYSKKLAANHGAPPYTWKLASGSLPHGLSLSSAGLIAGTPTAAGTARFRIRLIDSSYPTMSRTRRFTVKIARRSA